MSTVSNVISLCFSEIEERGDLVQFIKVNNRTFEKLIRVLNSEEDKICHIAEDDRGYFLWTADIELDNSIVDGEIHFSSDEYFVDPVVFVWKNK